MENLYFSLVFLAAILVSTRGDVCACVPCSSYKSRHDRCECCRYIQTGRKRSESLSSLAVTDNQDDSKLDAASYPNFESLSTLDDKQQGWLPLPQSGTPCSQTGSHLPNYQGNEDCIQFESSPKKEDDRIYNTILLDNKSFQTGRRFRSSYPRNSGNNRKMADFLLPLTNPEVVHNIAEVTRNRIGLASSKNNSNFNKLRRLFGWRAQGSPDPIPETPKDVPESVLPSEMAMSDGFELHENEAWS